MNSGPNFSLLDAARMPGEINKAIELNKSALSLYKGEKMKKLASVAPYLFDLKQGTGFLQWMIENAWGNAWGILFSASIGMEACERHFRKFLIVADERGQELYFRFYDPRVLRIFLPTCEKKQLIEFFGPVDYFIIENNTGHEGIKFWIEAGALHQKRVSTEEIFNTTQL